MAFTAVLALVVEAVFLRDALNARLPDVIVAPLVLAAWLAGRYVPRVLLIRQAAFLPIAAVVGIGMFAWRGYPLPIPMAVADRVQTVTARLRNVSPEFLPIVRYLETCTPADERVLVSGFAPEIPVLAGRRFAAGHPIFQPRYYTGAQDIQRALNQLSRETVSLAVLLDGPIAFRDSWPALAAELQDRGFVERIWRLDNQDVFVWLPAERANAQQSVTDGCRQGPPEPRAPEVR